MVDAPKFKSIPILPAQANQEHAEIKSCAEAEPFALRVIGDSMAPEFQDGHIIILDPAMAPENGSYVVIEYQGEITFSQFIVEANRKFLKPLNDAYPTVEMVENYTVRGVVVQRAGKRRSEHKHY
jgi:SOS-response transcriptional repressor LexA